MTTSEILEIPQIPVYDCGNLQNDLHIGFGTDLSKRFGTLRWTDETHATKRFPDLVDQPLGAYLTAFAAEDEAYVIAQKSQLVQQRKSKDEERDTLYKEVKKTIDTFALLSIFPEKQQAALMMQPVVQKYKIDPDGGIEAQTVATEQWLQEVNGSATQQLYASRLGLTESLQQLATLNDEVRSLTQAHNDENAQKALAALKNARRETDRAFNALRLVLNAMALTAGDDAYTYQEIIKNLQQTIKYYRQLSEQRRKKNAAAREKGKDEDKPSGSGSSSGSVTPTPEPEPDPTPDPSGDDDEGPSGNTNDNSGETGGIPGNGEGSEGGSTGGGFQPVIGDGD